MIEILFTPIAMLRRTSTHKSESAETNAHYSSSHQRCFRRQSVTGVAGPDDHQMGRAQRLREGGRSDDV